MAVPATQHLVTAAMLMPDMEVLQLRVGTDNTPSPYFHPSLNFSSPIHLTSLRLVQLDNKAILRSLGLALTTATRLRELTVWAETESQLSFTDISCSWQERVPFELKTLDLRGFVDLGRPPWALWRMLSPSKIKSLKLFGGPNCSLDGYSEFWDASISVELRPGELSTNLVVAGFKDFICAYSGLEIFNINSSNIEFNYPAEALVPLLDALRKQHSTTLRVLSIDPHEALAKHFLTDTALVQIANEFPNIEELRFGMANIVSVRVNFIVSLRDDSANYYPRAERYRLDIRAASNPAAPRHPRRLCNRGRRVGLTAKRAPGIESRPRQIKYVMFGSGFLYKILRDPVHVVQENLPLEYIHDMSLFGEKVYEWIGKKW